MTPVGELVNQFFHSMAQNDIQSALKQLYAFLQITAKKRNHMDVINMDMARSVLSEKMWIILPMGCQYILMPNLKLKVAMQAVESDEDGYITLDRILYQAMEDAERHIENDLLWIQNRGFLQERSGKIGLNTGLLWGILLALIVCPENRNEQTADMNWLSISTVKTFVNELWGREDFVRKVFLMEYGVEL